MDKSVMMLWSSQEEVR